MRVENSWWQDLEGMQTSAPMGADASHWTSVYTHLVQMIDRMLLDCGHDAAFRSRLECRRDDAAERLAYWRSRRSRG